MYLGNYYPLIILNEQNQSLIFDNAFFLSKNLISCAREIFINWYKAKALSEITNRAFYYSNKYGFEFSKIKISNAKTRWGSCSHKGNIYINWTLIMAPEDILDYVIIHELVHLEIPNHSKAFWNRLEIIYPNFIEAKKWLRDNANLLKI